MAYPQNPPRYPHQQKPGNEYVVVSQYRPQDVERCIACLTNDVIFVQTPYIFEFQGTAERPTGWLYGENTRTGEMGYVPADFVKFSGYIGMQQGNRIRPLLPPVSEEDDGTNTEAPPPVPERVRNHHSEGPQSVETHEWYFGSVTKEEVNRIMQGTATGTFLVRDSSNHQDGYTLTLRKDESNKLIRIHREGSKYGFSSPCEFNSVAELISFHKNETLARYNSELNICLLYSAQRMGGRPMSVGFNQEELINKLTNTQSQLIEKSTQYDEIYHDFNIRHQRIQHKKTAIDAYNKTIDIFRDQCAMLEESMNKSTRDEDRLNENFRKLQIRLQDISNQRKRLQGELEEDVQLNREKDPQLSSLKHLIQEIKREQDECISKLEMLGLPESEIRHQYLRDGLDDHELMNDVIDENQLRYRFPNHANRDNWFFNNYEREDAQKLLAGQEDGTFLIRPSRRAAFACSLICNGRVHHCLIKKTDEGYGFAEPFNLHQSLTDLVIHYAANSLLPHNDNLDTNLKVPAGIITRRR